MRFLSILSLIGCIVLIGCIESVPTTSEGESAAALDVAGKAHYAFEGVAYFNLAYFDDHVNNPAWFGEYTGPDGTIYTVLFMSVGSGKPYVDGFHSGRSQHYMEIVHFFTDVVLSESKAVVSGEPVLTLSLTGVVSPNDPLRKHFQSSGSVLDGTGPFASWIGRRTRSMGWLITDPDTGLPISAEGPLYIH